MFFFSLRSIRNLATPPPTQARGSATIIIQNATRHFPKPALCYTTRKPQTPNPTHFARTLSHTHKKEHQQTTSTLYARQFDLPTVIVVRGKIDLAGAACLSQPGGRRGGPNTTGHHIPDTIHHLRPLSERCHSHFNRPLSPTQSRRTSTFRDK